MLVQLALLLGVGVMMNSGKDTSAIPSPLVGKMAPDFALPGACGQTWSRDDALGPNGLLVMFVCNHCPYVQAVLDRLQLKRIVVGHTSMPHVSSFHGDRVIAVDSSIKNGENGELLFIEDGTLSRGLLDGSRVPLAKGQPGLQD